MITIKNHWSSTNHITFTNALFNSLARIDDQQIKSIFPRFNTCDADCAMAS